MHNGQSEQLTIRLRPDFNPFDEPMVRRLIDSVQRKHGDDWHLVSFDDDVAYFERGTADSEAAINRSGFVYDPSESESSWRGRADPMPAVESDARDAERLEAPREPIRDRMDRKISSAISRRATPDEPWRTSSMMGRHTYIISLRDMLALLFLLMMIVIGVEVSWWIVLGIALTLALAASITYGAITASATAQRRRDAANRELASRAPLENAWRDLLGRLDAVTSRWDAYESDPELFLTQPDIRNVSVPEVSDAIRALMTTRMLRSETVPSDVHDVASSRFAASVTEAEIAVEKAIQVTRERVRTTMSEDERSTLTQAQQILAVALDGSATPQERQLAYQRCCRLLETIGVALPDTVRAAIAARHRLLIEGKHHED